MYFRFAKHLHKLIDCNSKTTRSHRGEIRASERYAIEDKKLVKTKTGSFMESRLMEEAAQIVAFTELDSSSSSKARAGFQWGGTIAALFLLLLNRTGPRSRMQTNLLVLYLFTSFPTVVFKILRGQFGRWVAFLAVGANLFFPKTFPVARFILFVITPEWLANGLRDGIAAGIFCLIIGVLLIIAKIRGIGGFRNCECNSHFFGYFLGLALLFFCTILYLCLGTR